MFYLVISLLFIIAPNFSKLLCYLECLRTGISLCLVDLRKKKIGRAVHCQSVTASII